MPGFDQYYIWSSPCWYGGCQVQILISPRLNTYCCEIRHILPPEDVTKYLSTITKILDIYISEY